MIRIVILFCLTLFFSCKDKNKKYLSKKNNGSDEVYSIADDDEQMNQAVEKAAASYEIFLKKFQDPDSLCSDFCVELMFPYDDGNNEHMWLNELFYKNEKLFGILDSDPLYIPAVKSGDTIEIEKKRVSDWMYLRNDTMVGGYTLKVLYDKMDWKEKKQFRNEVDFVIE